MLTTISSNSTIFNGPYSSNSSGNTITVNGWGNISSNIWPGYQHDHSNQYYPGLFNPVNGSGFKFRLNTGIEPFNDTFWNLIRFHLKLPIDSDEQTWLETSGFICIEPVGAGIIIKAVEKKEHFETLKSIRSQLLHSDLLLPAVEVFGLLRFFGGYLLCSEMVGFSKAWRWLGILGRAKVPKSYLKSFTLTPLGSSVLAKSLPAFLIWVKEAKPESISVVLETVPYELWASALVALQPEDSAFWADALRDFRSRRKESIVE